jgi:hypothetical protein
MFIRVEKSGYNQDGVQFARGLFLMLVQTRESKEVRAIVRKTSLSQFGHFMMGFARVKGERLTLSGSYGSDGLPMTVSNTVFNEAIPLPDELYQAWAQGNGWNSAGNEVPNMRKWALTNLDKLYNV